MDNVLKQQVRNNLRVVLPSQQNRGGPEEAVVVSFLFRLNLLYFGRAAKISMFSGFPSSIQLFLQNGLQALNYGSNSQPSFQVKCLLLFYVISLFCWTI